MEDLDRRIVTASFLRHVVAREISDENSTSLECVGLCNAVVNLMDDNRDREQEVVVALRDAICKVREQFKKQS